MGRSESVERQLVKPDKSHRWEPMVRLSDDRKRRRSRFGWRHTLFLAVSYPATLWDSYVGIPGLMFMGQNFIEMSTGEYVGNPGQQPPVPVRWGDFNTMIYDLRAIPPGGEGSLWSVEEISNGPSDQSTNWVALADPTPLPYFVGSTSTEAECLGIEGAYCNVTINAPPGVQNGDVILVGSHYWRDGIRRTDTTRQ